MAFTDNSHPFDATLEQTINKVVENIKNRRQIIEKVLNCDEDYKKYCAIELIEQLTKLNPQKRPNCDSILNHVLFWDKYKMFNFIKKCNLEERNIFCERDCEKIIGHDWRKKIDSKLLDMYSNGNEERTLQGLIKLMAQSVSLIYFKNKFRIFKTLRFLDQTVIYLYFFKLL